MTDYIEIWYRNLVTLTSGTIKREYEAWGESIRHEPSQHAKVKIRLGPSNDLRILDQLDPEKSARMKHNGYFDWVIFGVLDVMFTGLVGPYRLFQLTILDVEIDDIKSTQMAFRLAARDATVKILRQIG